MDDDSLAAGAPDDDDLTDLARRLDRASAVPRALTGDPGEARRRGRRRRRRRIGMAVAAPLVVVAAVAGAVGVLRRPGSDRELVATDAPVVATRTTPAGELVVRAQDDDRLVVEVADARVVVPRRSHPLPPFETLALPGVPGVFGVTSGATIPTAGGAIAVVTVVVLDPAVAELRLVGRGPPDDHAPVVDGGAVLAQRSDLDDRIVGVEAHAADGRVLGALTISPYPVGADFDCGTAVTIQSVEGTDDTGPSPSIVEQPDLITPPPQPACE